MVAGAYWYLPLVVQLIYSLKSGCNESPCVHLLQGRKTSGELYWEHFAKTLVAVSISLFAFHQITDATGAVLHPTVKINPGRWSRLVLYPLSRIITGSCLRLFTESPEVRDDPPAERLQARSGSLSVHTINMLRYPGRSLGIRPWGSETYRHRS